MCEDRVDIQNYNKLFASTTHALDQLVAPTHRDARGRSDLGVVKFNDFVYAVGDSPDHDRLAFELKLHHDDPCFKFISGRGETKFQTKIDDRSSFAAYIDHPAHIQRRGGDLGDLRQFQDLSHLCHFDRKELIAELEGEILNRFVAGSGGTHG